jgi:hypothetical protein
MRLTAGMLVLAAAMFVATAAVYVTSFTLAPNMWMRVAAVLLGAFAAAGMWLAVASSRPLARVRTVDIACSLLATLATFFLSRDLGVQPVVAASLVLITIGVAVQPLGLVDGRAARAGFAGVFVGLIGPSITVPWYWVALSGALAGVLWSLVGPSIMPGFGGRIGLVAFMSSVVAYGIADFLGGKGNVTLLPPTDGLPTWTVVPVGVAAALVTWTLYNRTSLHYLACIGIPALVVSSGIALAPNLGAQGAVLATAWLGGAALAGTTSARLPNAAWIFVAGLLYAGLMVRFTGPYQGHAGVIGVLALIGELGTFALRRALQRVAPWLPGQPRVA